MSENPANGTPNQIESAHHSEPVALRGLLKQLYHRVHDAVFVADAHDLLVYRNPTAARLIGPEASAQYGIPVPSLLSAIEQHPENGNMTTTFKLKRGEGIEYRIRMTRTGLDINGQSLLLYIGRLQPGKAERLPRVLSRKPAEIHDGHTAELLLRYLMDNIPDNIYFKDIDSRFIMVNEAFCQYIGLESDDIIGKTDSDLFAGTHAVKARDDEAYIIQTGKSLVGIEEEETWADGHRSWVSTTKMPLKTADGSIIGTFGISRDITSRKSMEHEREARIRAEESTEAKTVFLANMSHEMRTPLSAIVGVGDLLVGTLLDEEQKDYVGTIGSSSEALLDIVNSVLDLSKIEAGKLNLESVPFHVHKLIHKTLDVIKQPALSMNNILSPELDDAVPETLRGDPVRLRQVLLNLLSNANKFTRDGTIKLRVATEFPDLRQVRLRFEVSDTGIGMDPEQIPRLFQPYEQAERSTTRNYGGTGLGLAICNKLVEQMGGQLSITSQKGIGTQIQFSILLERCTDDPEEEENAGSGLSGQHILNRILLVEDNCVNREVIRRILDKLGYDADMAVNGEEAVLAARNRSYDLILMDVQMPVMDGLEATRIIKRKNESTKTCKPLIVGLSAHALKEHHEQAAEAGMDAYLTKPVRIRDLEKLFSRL